MRTATLVLAAFFSVPVALAGQNNGLPSQAQTAVLMELIADRGEECDLLRPWQAESLRIQIRDLVEGFDEARRVEVAEQIESRRPRMRCDDALLNGWIEGAEPNFEREYLPELLEGYRALALLDPPLEAFAEVTGRTDYAPVFTRIDAKLAELEAAGVQPRAGWSALAERQAGFAVQLAAVLAGTDENVRFTPEEATRTLADVARVVELWLLEER